MEESRRWYLDRLSDHSLIDDAVAVKTWEDEWDLCIPVGGSRVTGSQNFGSPVLAAKAMETLWGYEGFPDLVLNADSDGCCELSWGVPLPEHFEVNYTTYLMRLAVFGGMFGYSEEAITKFLLDVERRAELVEKINSKLETEDCPDCNAVVEL